MAMRWYARPENQALQLRVAPRLASWNKADDPDQLRLREYLDDTEALLAASKVKGPWALRLDVGLPPERDLLNMADLDNYAYPLAYRLKDPALVSVWCTKRHSEQSFVRIEPAEEVFPPSTGWLVATTTASASTVAYKEQIHAAVAGAAGLPAGPVRLELSFVVGPRRNWLNLWKQTIDSLDPILGRTYPNRDWNPLDGRITELGLHLTVDPAVGNAIQVGVAAGQARDDVAVQVNVRAAARANGWQVLTANNHEDRYQLPGEPDNWIVVTWSASGNVLSAYGGADSFISRWDGYPDVSAKTERVLSALKGRTGVFPQHRPNDPAVVHNSTPDASGPPIDGLIDQELLLENKVGVREPCPLVFRDDDAGYLTWLAAHPNGYVINIARSHSATASRLHHADCRTINGQNPHQGAWTGPYVKVCAEQLADLEEWATNNVREPIPPCGTCNPESVP